MANIDDYVKWRGDLSFKERSFKIEDNLVLSELAYVDFKEVISSDEKITLCDAVERAKRKGPIHVTRAGSTKEDEDFIITCGESIRFGKAILEDYQDIIDYSDKQFAAVTYNLDDGTTVIAFRGTDSTIIGWKEDFMISYTNVPSQELALEYAKKHVAKAQGKVIICGHSKGAHLALYAAAHLPDESKDKLTRVYMNDGPGFCDDVLDKSLIDTIRDKLTTTTPEYSIIGRLYETKGKENYIVRSSAMALMQHSMKNWEISESGLVTCGDHSPESYLLNDLIKRFVEGMDLGARENFVDTLFDSMAEGGVTTIKEFAVQGPAAFEKILVKMAGNDALNIKNKAANIKKEDDKSKNIFTRIWGLVNRKKVVRIAVSLVLSTLCFLFPDFAMESVISFLLVALCIYEVVLTIRHLKESEWNFKKERPRVSICIVLWVGACAVLVKHDALFVISSMVVGIVLLTLAYQNVINFRIYNDKYFERFRYSFEGIVTLILGGYILVVPEIGNSWYMYSCGFLLLIDSIFEILKVFRDRGKQSR
ncbi:DUF2974 domain-containing protein [Butyrivibrio sp. DSM 10294]|uniref:Mbeg1-like protein n=1 Tax=Butyrivibrio sp. DSM 10294 TaxID=2972457 RepID=UPI00234E4FFF|nr:Mbeg1-like protein [Butyrivibrio sp. DSM 10294]MDC7295102.1 DUF2974 domain-containing protein [Butyrivibrio sp. DSM 10294]